MVRPASNEELQAFQEPDDDYYMELNLPDLDVSQRAAAQRRRSCIKIGLIFVGFVVVCGLVATGVALGVKNRGSGSGDSVQGPGEEQSPPPKPAPTSPPTPQQTAAPAPTAKPAEGTETGKAPTSTFKVIESFPHDKDAFTQGFLVENGVFFESTGIKGQSSLRRVDIQTGTVKVKRDLPDEYFAEGLAAVGNKLYQLTWQSHLGFIYKKGDLEPLGNWTYEGEGWGLTPDEDDEVLYMSDGSSYIRVLDPHTLEEIKDRIAVKDDGKEVENLNELEYVDGEIWANIWLTNRIARIDPVTGTVLSWIDCTNLLRPDDIPAGHRPNVLNGIAYDPSNRALYVTGKLWPKIYKIEVVDGESQR